MIGTDRTNMAVTLYETFTHGSRSYSDVLKFEWKNWGNKPPVYYLLPREDGEFSYLRGYGVRDAVLAWIDFIFQERGFRDYARIVEHFKNWPETVIVKAGTYKE